MLRGYFASSTNAVIVPWVLGATSGTGVTNLPAEVGVARRRCVGVCGRIAAVALLRARSTGRVKLAAVLDASASMVDERWTGSGYSDEQMAAPDASIASLQSVYDGVLSRPGGGTSRERLLMLAVDEESTSHCAVVRSAGAAKPCASVMRDWRP